MGDHSAIEWTDATGNPVTGCTKMVGGRTPKAGGRLLDGRTWDAMPATRLKGQA